MGAIARAWLWLPLSAAGKGNVIKTGGILRRQLCVLLIEKGPNSWEAETIEQRLVASGSSAFDAYNAIRNTVDNRMKVDELAGCDPATDPSWQSFRSATQSFAMRTRITVAGEILDVLVHQTEEGWFATGLQHFITSGSGEFSPSAAFSVLLRLFRAIVRDGFDALNKIEAAPTRYQYTAGSCESFGLPPVLQG